MPTLQVPVHRGLFGDQIHIPHRWEFNNASDRISASGLLASDIKKIALQLDDNTYWTLRNNTPVLWEQIGGGGGASSTGVSATITQNNHGFSVLNAIYHNSGIWQKAIANDSVSLGTHIVTAVLDANTFIATQVGRVIINAHGLNVDNYYYVSQTTAGAITDVEPVSGFSNPIVFVLDSNTIEVKEWQAISISSGSPQGVLTGLPYWRIVINNNIIMASYQQYNVVNGRLVIEGSITLYADAEINVRF